MSSRLAGSRSPIPAENSACDEGVAALPVVQSWWKLINRSRVPANSRAGQVVASMITPGQESNCAFTTIDAWEEEPVFSDHPEAKCPKPVEKLRPIVYSSLIGCSDRQLSAWPFCYLPLFLVMYKGRSIVTLLPATSIVDIQDPQAWLMAAKPGALDRFPSWLMPEGSVLYCPMGSVPIVIGVPEEFVVGDKKADVAKAKAAIAKRRDTDPKPYITYGVWPMFDSAWTKLHVPKTVSQVSVSLAVRGSTLYPNSWKDNKELSTWRQELLVHAESGQSSKTSKAVDIE